MFRAGLALLAIACICGLLMAAGVATVGPCGGSVGSMTVFLALLLSIPAGGFLILLAGVRAGWRRIRAHQTGPTELHL